MRIGQGLFQPGKAETAVRAAQVGRLVLSTLHTNSAAGAVSLLVDLGVPEFLLRDVLRGVLGQELLVMPCPDCGGKGCSTCGVEDRTTMRFSGYRPDMRSLRSLRYHAFRHQTFNERIKGRRYGYRAETCSNIWVILNGFMVQKENSTFVQAKQ